MTEDDIDPAAKPTRRSFTAEYKAEILAEYDTWPKGSDERGAILRREGLYSSHISEWRKQADAGAREGLARKSKKRRSAEEIELDKLRRQNERLTRELEKTQTALEITGKVHALSAALRERGHREQVEAVIAEHLPALEEVTSTKKACELLGVNRSTVLRRRRPQVLGPPPPRPAPPNKLTETERQHVLSVLRSERYCDLAPAQVWAQLLDDGIYLCSIRTMYRLLAAAGESRERRRQRTHPARKKPELIARGPNQVWSWDITKLAGPERGVYYELFVIIDIYSRYVVAWTVAAAETGELAEAFIADAFDSRGVGRDELTLHADRGSSMTSKPVAQLLVDLGVTRSHSRPSVSNDNPYSEAQFKTLKYCPAFPGRFGSIADARAFCSAFFDHYNHVHRHAGIGLHTPASVHYGTATEIRAVRAQTLTAAYNANLARFRHRPPTPPKLPTLRGSTSPTEKHSSNPRKKLSHVPLGPGPLEASSGSMTDESADAWWANVSRSAPSELGGLWFGLVELARGGWHIYVSGTAEFDADDETAEWAVGPYVWWPEEDRYFPFPAAGGDDIGAALAAASEFVERLSPWTTVNVTGVATGFDDGDFVIVRPG